MEWKNLKRVLFWKKKTTGILERYSQSKTTQELRPFISKTIGQSILTNQWYGILFQNCEYLASQIRNMNSEEHYTALGHMTTL